MQYHDVCMERVQTAGHCYTCWGSCVIASACPVVINGQSFLQFCSLFSLSLFQVVIYCLFWWSLKAPYLERIQFPLLWCLAWSQQPLVHIHLEHRAEEATGQKLQHSIKVTFFPSNVPGFLNKDPIYKINIIKFSSRTQTRPVWDVFVPGWGDRAMKRSRSVVARMKRVYRCDEEYNENVILMR